MMLADLTQLSDEELSEKYSSYEAKRDLRHEFQVVELALKNDLGIYVVEFSEDKGEFGGYQEVEDAVARKLISSR